MINEGAAIDLQKEIEEAMKRLRKEIKATSSLVKDDVALKQLWEAGIVLLDAINKQFMSKESYEQLKERDKLRELEERVNKLEGK